MAFVSGGGVKVGRLADRLCRSRPCRHPGVAQVVASAHGHGGEVEEAVSRSSSSTVKDNVSVDFATPATLEFIMSGPLFKKAGLHEAMDSFDWSEWFEYGAIFNNDLKHLNNEATNKKIYWYYLPLYFWMRNRLRRKLRAAKDGNSEAVVFGLSAPQGGMKTVMTAILVKLFDEENMTCVTIGTDDFYLTYKEQRALAQKYSTNPLLEFRGNPGTVDVPLMNSTIEKLKAAKEGDVVYVPRYNKSAYGGMGDRFEEDQWTAVKGPVDVLILEGWSLGFRPVENPSPAMKDINEFLKEFTSVYDFIDHFTVVQIPDPTWVFSWRQEAEDRMKRRGLPGMSEHQVKKFVERFLPAYHEYLPGLYAGNVIPGRGDQLNIHVDFSRTPVE